MTLSPEGYRLSLDNLLAIGYCAELDETIVAPDRIGSTAGSASPSDRRGVLPSKLRRTDRADFLKPQVPLPNGSHIPTRQRSTPLSSVSLASKEALPCAVRGGYFQCS